MGFAVFFCFLVCLGRPPTLRSSSEKSISTERNECSRFIQVAGDGREGENFISAWSRQLSTDKSLGQDNQSTLFSGKMVLQWRWASRRLLPSELVVLYIRCRAIHPGISFHVFLGASHVSPPALGLLFPVLFAFLWLLSSFGGHILSLLPERGHGEGKSHVQKCLYSALILD